MAGPHCSELTLVQGGELHLPEPFHHGSPSETAFGLHDETDGAG
jgi:hypothetical protein